MANSSLPVVGRRAGGGWFDAMPEWLDRPEHFHGLARRRVLAYLADLAVLWLIGVAIWGVFAILIAGSLGLLFPVVMPLYALVPLIPLAYHTLLIGGRRSSTIGMRLFDIEMRSWTGERPQYLQAFIGAALFYLTVALTAGIILLVGVFNRRRRLAHDLLSGMVAVRASAMGGARHA